MKKKNKKILIIFIIIAILLVAIIVTKIIEKEILYKNIGEEAESVFNQYLKSYIESKYNGYSSYKFIDRLNYEERTMSIFETYRKVKGKYVYRYEIIDNNGDEFDIYYRNGVNNSEIIDNYDAKQMIKEIKLKNEEEKYKYVKVETPIATRDSKISTNSHTIKIYLDNSKYDLTDEECYNQMLSLKDKIVNQRFKRMPTDVYIFIGDKEYFLLQSYYFDDHIECKFYNRINQRSTEVKSYEDYKEAF